jgi:hypothetical protein
VFATRPQLAGALLDRADAAGIRAAFVAGDEVYGGRELRRSIRQHGMGYVLAVRANHTVTVSSGRTVTAAAAAGLIPDRAWHRMRTGSGTKGTRHYDWAMLEVASDDTPDGHGDGHSVLLARRHRYTGQLSFYRCWTPGPVPLSKLITIASARWRVEEDHQLSKQVADLDAGQVIRWRSWHRWTAICLLAYLYLAVAVAVAVPARRRLRPGHRADPGHRPRTGAAPARHRHPAAPARPGPPPALVELAPPPPAPRPPSPPTLERLRRDNAMITTNYSCRSYAPLGSAEIATLCNQCSSRPGRAYQALGSPGWCRDEHGGEAGGPCRGRCQQRGRPAAQPYPGQMRRPGPVTRAVISLALWPLIIIFCPVIVLAGSRSTGTSCGGCAGPPPPPRWPPSAIADGRPARRPCD